MAEPTKADPLGEGDHRQSTYVLEGVQELTAKVSALENGRFKSILLTKLDEMRHWTTDLINQENFYAADH